MTTKLSDDNKLLFVGDSITDCGRREDPEELGSGYVRLIAEWLTAEGLSRAPKVVNRGIGGNKITDLDGRWENDVLAENADVVTMMIGINDVWHGLVPEWAPGVDIGKFRELYRRCLARLRERSPLCRIILCEPTVIWSPAPAQGNDLLQPYIEVVHEMAREFDVTALVPLHQILVSAKCARPDVKWVVDGVHPSTAGHMLIARTWLKSIGLI